MSRVLTRIPSPGPDATAHADDLYTWAMEQAALLRAGDLSALDRENLAEEIESLGRSEYNRLVSFYALIQLHILKWDHQPNHRSASWAISIATHRQHAHEVLAENPGLKSRCDEAFAKAYRGARLDTIRETGLADATFPATCPFTRDAAMTRPFRYE